jgi:hypothetical protein
MGIPAIAESLRPHPPKNPSQDLHISEQSATFVGMNPLARIKQVLNNRKKAPVAVIEGGFIGFPVGKLLFFTRLISRAVAVPEHVSALLGRPSALLGRPSALPDKGAEYGRKKGRNCILMGLLLTN